MEPSRFTFPSPGFSRYWNEGRGKSMLKQLTSVPQENEIRACIPLLFQCDELADAVIREVYQKMGFRSANELIDQTLEHYPAISDNVPESLQQLLHAFHCIPDWLERTKAETGATLCRRAGVNAFIVLRNYCLMGGYESAAINKPLIFTEALQKGASKRITETTEFWYNATGEQALLQQGPGFKHALKIRLMHAYARVSVEAMSDWDTAAWGKPINHWDMVATNLGFSIVFLDGLKSLGIKPTVEEEEGLFHLWKYLGYLLGIPENLLPNTKTEAIRELYLWTMSQPPADADTCSLAESLMNEPINASFPKRKWQKKLALQVHLSYNQFFLGKTSCQNMGLPKSKLTWVPYLTKFTRSASELFAFNKGYRKKQSYSGRKKQLAIINKYLRSNTEN